MLHTFARAAAIDISFAIASPLFRYFASDTLTIAARSRHSVIDVIAIIRRVYLWRITRRLFYIARQFFRKCQKFIRLRILSLTDERFDIS